MSGRRRTSRAPDHGDLLADQPLDPQLSLQLWTLKDLPAAEKLTVVGEDEPHLRRHPVLPQPLVVGSLTLAGWAADTAGYAIKVRVRHRSRTPGPCPNRTRATPALTLREVLERSEEKVERASSIFNEEARFVIMSEWEVVRRLVEENEGEILRDCRPEVG